MRIAILHPDLGYLGGDERLISYLTTELANMGHTLYIASARPNDIILSLPNTHFHALPLNKVNELDKYFITYVNLLKLFKQVDIVNFHNYPISLHLTPIVALKNSSNLPPLIWYVHEPYSNIYAKNYQDYLRIRDKLPPHLKLIEKVELYTIPKITAIIANSKRTAKFTELIFKKPVSTVYPGIPEVVVSSKTTMQLPSIPYFLVVSRWGGRVRTVTSLPGWVYPKNAISILKAFVILKKITQNPFKLVVLGEPPNLQKKTFEELVKKTNTTFLGTVSDEDLAVLYEHALAVLTLSVDEPFGLTLLEAWRHKKPVILSKDAGSAEIATHTRNALITTPTDPYEIAINLKFILENPKKGAKMGEEGYKVWYNHFRPIHMAKNFLDAIGSYVKVPS